MRCEDWSRLIVEAAQLGCRELQFIGGEPTMHPDLQPLIVQAREQGFASVEVFTNATRLGGDLIRCFREYGVEVASSFYSDDPSIHARITGSSESWQRTVDGFQNVLAAGLSLRVGVIEMEENAGQVARTTNFLNTLGVRRVRSDRLRRVGRGGLQQIGKRADEFDELCGQCWKGRLCVTPSGIAFPCVFGRKFPMGDARNGLSAILESARLADFRTGLRFSRERQDGGSCRPDCTPNEDCLPKFCYPDSGGCSPNIPSECSPDK